MKICQTVALAMIAVVIGSVMAMADSWPAPRPLVFAAAYGAYGFKTRPPQLAAWSNKAHGTLFTSAPDGSEDVMWSRELVNIPVRAFVADDGKHLVTFDTWARLGYEHALVIYGEQGRVVVDYELEALLPQAEIEKSVVQTVGSRQWLHGSTIAFDEAWKTIVITLHWGKIIRINLSTGRIETSR